jgi:uncharacterized membrane protein (UPF0127 family)
VTTRRAWLMAVAAAGLAACLASPAPAQAPSFDHLREARLEVTGGGKSHVFRAWVADTPATRSRGLMFVRELPPDRGMLFLFEAPYFASFWMKDTYIPLDLLFVSPDGRIANVIENATPLSLAPLESVAPVTAVLELAGGTAARLGIAAGDRLRVLEAPASVTR